MPDLHPAAAVVEDILPETFLACAAGHIPLLEAAEVQEVIVKL
jgi:hypothetical protein